ncbi:MAG: hypothetical protein M1830_008743 [Pleopsidium flavum]|nr:MAG: hypothetical protein M1830_008743 [Pleopsidium flavum]
MAFSAVGFDSSIDEALKANRKSSKKVDAEICSMLKLHTKKFRRHYKGAKPAALTAVADDSFSLARRVTVNAGRRVDPEILLSLKQLQEQDQKTAQVLLAGLNGHPDSEDAQFSEISAMHRCAVRALIQEDTDKLTQQTGAVAPTTDLRHEAVKLYEQFFDVCQIPNEAEIALLARVGGTTAARVTEWFDQKRERMKPLFVARAVSGRDGPIAKYLREQRLGKGRPMIRKKPVTRH